MESGSKTIQLGTKLRTLYFKGSSSPKDITTLDFRSKTAAVFEGFSDVLSYLASPQNEPGTQTKFLILNSIFFLGKSRLTIEKNDAIRLYLDRNSAGQNCS